MDEEGKKRFRKTTELSYYPKTNVAFTTIILITIDNNA
jgi:hypothetical protein